MNQRIPLTLIALLLLAASAAAAPVQRIHEIQKPLFNVPAIVAAGKAFTLEIKTTESRKIVSVSLEPIGKPGKHIALVYKPVSSAGETRVFSADVPSGTPEALYDIAVQFDDNQTDYQPHAVKVVKQFKNEFDFIQVTDIHFNIQDIPGKDMNRIRRFLLQDASAHNPEFIIFTGDLALEPPTYDWDYVYAYQQMSGNLTVPVFMVPGNHEMYYDKVDGREIDGSLYWAAAYGPMFQSFDYGKMHFIGMDDFDSEAWSAPMRMRRSHDAMFFGSVLNAAISDRQWKWVQDDLAASKARGLSCVAYAHIPIETLQGGRKVGMPAVKIQGPDPDTFVKTLTDADCSYLFVGHNHYNKINKFGGLTEVLTMASGTGTVEGKWGYQIIHVKDGKIAGMKLREIRFEDLK